MEKFGYTAFAVDGHCGARSGDVSAANKTEAEKKVRALYSYPVNIRWDIDWVPTGLLAGIPGSIKSK